MNSRRFPASRYRSRAWAELRRSIIEERGPRCERCGHVPDVIFRRGRRIDSHDLALHHKRQDGPFLDDPEHLEILCRSCHSEHHGGPKTTGLETPLASSWKQAADAAAIT